MKTPLPSHARRAVAGLLTSAMLAAPGVSAVYAADTVKPVVLAAVSAAAAPAAPAAATVVTPLPAVAASPAMAALPPFADPNALVVGNLSSVPAPTIAARAWIVIDVTSGQTLAASNADQPMPPASLTKIMTSYVAFNAVDEKRLMLDQQVPVSERAWRTGGSRMFIQPRLPVTVDQLFQGLIVQSGNDAAVALAEAVAGSAESFVTLMNEQAAKLGMKNTHFTNVDGLPDPQHLSTARDLAIVSVHAIIDHPQEFHYYKQRDFTYNKISQPNRNRLLWADPSVDGMKTGFTDAAGYCMIATALRGDRRILVVVLGADSIASRAEESLKLLNWGFQNFDVVKLYGADQPGLDVRVWEGTTDTARLGPPQPLWVSVPRGKGADLKPVANYPDPLLAPLVKGQQVGTIDLTLDGKTVRTLPLVARSDVERAGFFSRVIDSIKRYFSSK